MIASLLNELFATVVQTLPRLFIVGAPVLFIALLIAAFADTRMPGSTDRPSVR